MTAPALIETRSGQTITHQELEQLDHKFGSIFTKTSGKKLVLISAANRINVIAALRGALTAGHAVLLCDNAAPLNYFQKLISLYQPEILVLPRANSYSNYRLLVEYEGLFLYKNSDAASNTLHPDLALLLTTSGSTGSPKLVRLSYDNIIANTADIIEALKIQGKDCVAAHMPLAYSYGLSVVNTHLAANASVALFEDNMTTNNFWKSLREHKVTSLPGVPYHFTLMHRLGLERLQIPDVTTMTQAGGRLENELITYFADEMQKRHGRFYVMYGQTEASPRMTVLPAESVLDKTGSVGLPLRDGKIIIDNDEIIYTGPNVMMGYAENRADLAHGDDMHGRLATGDVGYLDSAGYLFLTGRKSHFAKIDGLRVSLDEVEQFARNIAPTVAIEKKDEILLFTTGDAAAVREHVIKEVGLHPSRVKSQSLVELPYLSNGKVDLNALREF